MNRKNLKTISALLMCLVIIIYFWCMPMLIISIIFTWEAWVPDNVIIYKIFYTVAASILILSIGGAFSFMYWRELK